ncbi:MAG: tetratricopeptide repeat protein, partial [Steroidobacteraceae bacterium]
LQAMGDYAGAEPLYRRALEIREKSLGPEHPHTGSSLFNLAYCLELLDQTQEAIELYGRELAIVQAREGEASISAAQTQLRLGRLLRDAGDHVEALRCLNTAEATFLREGEEYADNLATVFNLRGQTHAVAGDFPAAVADFEQALELASLASPDDQEWVMLMEKRLSAARRGEVWNDS